MEGKYESSGSRFKSGSNISDANTVHIEYSLKAGSYCFKVAYNNTANIPVNTNGMLVHTQRADYDNVSTANIVKQVYNSHTATFIRHGRGDGENIVFSDWQRIDNFGYNTLAELSEGVAGLIGAVAPISITLGVGEEFDTGVAWIGTITLFVASTGRAMIIAGESQVFSSTNVIFKGDGTFSVDLSESGTNCINKKSTNGTIILKNNTSSSKNYRIKFG